MKELQPDFIGNFMLLGDEEQQRIREEYAGITMEEYNQRVMLGSGLFKMYIEKREKIGRGTLEKISGKIIDNYGEALFNGEMGKFYISFVKKYCQGSDASIDYEIPYEGTFDINKSTFSGKYLMKGNKKPWKGMFVLLSAASILNNIFDGRLN